MITTGKQFLFADHSGDFDAATAHDMERDDATDVQLSLTGVANGAGRQSAKADLGNPRARLYSVIASIEFDAASTVGSTVDFYWGPSTLSTAASGNPAELTGSDATYTGTTGGSLAQSVPMLQYIGSLILADDVAPQPTIGPVGIFTPQERYGMLVVVNSGGQALEGDDIEMFISMSELVED